MKALYWFIGIIAALVLIFATFTDALVFNYIFQTPPLLCICIWIGYALLDAIWEAMYFTLKARNSMLDKINEHPMFMLQRGLVLVLIGYILQAFYPCFLLCLMFPFVHDGMYYLVRDMLDSSYPQRWIARPKKSTAIFDIVFQYPLVRIISFAVAVALYIKLYI